jgi:hypothetical protein
MQAYKANIPNLPFILDKVVK